MAVMLASTGVELNLNVAQFLLQKFGLGDKALGHQLSCQLSAIQLSL